MELPLFELVLPVVGGVGPCPQNNELGVAGCPGLRRLSPCGLPRFGTAAIKSAIDGRLAMKPDSEDSKPSKESILSTEVKMEDDAGLLDEWRSDLGQVGDDLEVTAALSIITATTKEGGNNFHHKLGKLFSNSGNFWVKSFTNISQSGYCLNLNFLCEDLSTLHQSLQAFLVFIRTFS